MNQETLFAYLEGTLSAEEREKLETQLAIDPQLQRELATAREAHRQSSGFRDGNGTVDDADIPAPPSKLGQRVATVFVCLVVLNVLVGIAFIIGNKKSDKSDSIPEKELAARQQIEASLEKTAEIAIPAPNIDVAEVRISAGPNEWKLMAENVVTLASHVGGRASKAPQDSTGITVLAEVPADRADEFRQSLAPLAETDFSPSPKSNDNNSPGEKVNVYVRITQASPAPPQ
jgi:hypothetical protein